MLFFLYYTLIDLNGNILIEEFYTKDMRVPCHGIILYVRVRSVFQAEWEGLPSHFSLWKRLGSSLNRWFLEPSISLLLCLGSLYLMSWPIFCRSLVQNLKLQQDTKGNDKEVDYHRFCATIHPWSWHCVSSLIY